MKFGIRKPSISKSLKARTTGRAKRALKRALNPVYGKKGMGIINNPKKAIYNAVYNKTTIGVSDIINVSNKTNLRSTTSNNVETANSIEEIKANSILKENKSYKKKTIKLNEECNRYRRYVCETDDPFIFFSSYKMLIEKLQEMAKYEEGVQWYYGTPTQMLEETYKVKEKAMNEFIKRYFEKTISKKGLFTNNQTLAKRFKTNLELYGKDDMTDNNKKLYMEFVEKLKNIK